MIYDLKVPASKLKRKCKLSKFKFSNTNDVNPLKDIIGQERGVRALEFGLSIKKKGYNIFVSGISGTGRSSHSYSMTSEFASKKETPDDWCYVYNFDKPDSPIALSFKSGDGIIFKKEVEDIIENLKIDFPQIFSSKDYEDKRAIVYNYFKKKIESVICELNETAKEYNFVFKQTEKGLLSIPIVNGELIKDEDIKSLPKEEVTKIKENSNELSKKTLEIVKRLREIEDVLRDKLEELDEEIAFELIYSRFNSLLQKFEDNNKVRNYIIKMQEDIILNLDEFLEDEEEEEELKNILSKNKLLEDFFKRYEVNLFINNVDRQGAPVIKESNPLYYNLLGKVEHINELGALKTDHTKIRPGSIHEANGGYLLIQAKDLITNYVSWEGLKRCLINEESKVENINKDSILAESIKPEPIPLDIKIILIGDYYTYQLLYLYDDEFKELFRIRADFDVEMDRNEENIKKIISFIANHCKEENLRPFHKSAIEEIIEYSSRLADHQKKLTTRFNRIVEIMYEADTWAEFEDVDVVKREHIKKAIDEKYYRNNKYEEKIQHMIEKENIIIDTNTWKVGEINGLAVIDLGEYSFGKPSKITASTFVGKDGIINIEREVSKSGSIHDKGVLILSGYLGEKYATKTPLSLSASITFEQSYDTIEGDSASSTELYALLSSLSGLPINQGIATTGSVNQKGIIQPIGGVNEKIEGFFKICKIKGLTGNEGVIIPYQNIENLMLSDEVIKAVRQGKFSIYAIKTIDEGIEILTGIPYGKKDENEKFPVGTISYFIQRKLNKYAKSDKS